jgi:hypothetical protein
MLSRLKPLYCSLHVAHTLTDTSYTSVDASANIYAAVTTDYDTPIIDKASNYLVAVERFELSLNAIPFYSGEDKESIFVRSKSNPLLHDNYDMTSADSSYSLTELLDNLNRLTFEHPDHTSVKIQGTFTIDKNGYIIMKLKNATFAEVTFEFPRRLNMILGIFEADQVSGDNVKSRVPRLDMGDNLDHIILKTNLPTFTDSLGNVKTNVMTDFSVPSSFSTSCAPSNADLSLVQASISVNSRQRAIYTPQERRYLELIGDFPVQSISIDAFYVTPQHELRQVMLPFGGIFEIKLGFYLKS